MAWYDTHQAAVNPDNPAANEQITFDEWNAMVTYLKDKIVDKTVNTAAIGNDKVLVYKTASSTFVFEAQSAVGAIDDLTDVTISGVPADNEVMAYDTGTSEWINQTAAEAGLATVAGLAAYYPLSGATMTGNLNMGDYQINGLNDLKAYDTSGMLLRDSAAAAKIMLASTTYSFHAWANGNMGGSYKIINHIDPSSAQDVSTKNYDDTHLFTKEIVTSFTDGYIPVYRTASGKFEMEEGGGTAGLPVADTTNIVKGSADGTKLMRFEVDGLTTGVTRVMTVPDKDITLCDTDEVLMNPAGESLDMAGYRIFGINHLFATSDSSFTYFKGGPEGGYSPEIVMYGKDYASVGGKMYFNVSNAAKTGTLLAMRIEGGSDTPEVLFVHGINLNDTAITDMKNSAASALSGTQKDIEIDIGGTPYYFTVYPTKA